MHRAYVLATTGLALATAFCLIAVNFVTDPYGIHPDVTGHSPGGKRELIRHMRIHKPYALQTVRAEHIVIGSSRSASLPPGVLGEHAYNASLPGLWMRELQLMLEHAHAVRPLKSVFIGLDYYMFRQENTGKIREDLAETRLLKPNPSPVDRFAHLQQLTRDYWSSLFSVDVLVESAAMMSTGESHQVYYLEDGTWFGDPTKSRKWLYSYVNKKRMREFLAESGALTFREFEGLLDFLAAEDIAATLFISPFHGSVMNSVRMAGEWKEYLAWQRSVSERVDAQGADFRVAGIEHNREIILEPIETDDPFFTDGMHYTRGAGATIMNCVVRGECTERVTANRLSPDNTSDYLRQVDRLMTAYPEENPEDFAALRRWLAEVKAPHP